MCSKHQWPIAGAILHLLPNCQPATALLPYLTLTGVPIANRPKFPAWHDTTLDSSVETIFTPLAFPLKLAAIVDKEHVGVWNVSPGRVLAVWRG